MGSTLEHGIYLPSEGEKNCYQGLAGNWNKVDGALGDIAELRQLIENKFTKEIVTELPTEDINPYCIYMILKTVTETDNIYDEWVYINNAWEYLGNTKVDMTQYYTKQEVNQLPAVASGVTATKVGNYDAHIANGDIHVTASDKAKWTNSANTHVLRLALSALTPSTSDNSFSNLDDSTALKVGDKVMDTAGVLFEVTAIDTQNSTFTIGTALVDLAQDSDVVHKSGYETVGGVKTFTDSMRLKSNVAEYGVTEGNIQFYLIDKNNFSLSKITQGVYNNGVSYITLQLYGKDSNNQTVTNTIRYQYSSDFNYSYVLPTDTGVWLGSTGNRWGKIYGIQYYYGSNNIEFSTKFVTTDTNQIISGAKTFSDSLTIYNNDSSQNTKNLTISSSKIQVGDTSNSDSFGIVFNAGLSYVSRIMAFKDTSGTQNLQFAVRTKDSSNNFIGAMIRLRSYANGFNSFESDGDNLVSLGSSSNKWKNVQTYQVNSLEPSSLSLPSGNASDVIDISSYLVNLDGTDNTYVAPANGWITINMNNCTGIHATITGFWGDSRVRASAGAIKFLMPVLKNQTVTLTIHGGTINNARFIPCQGNV